MRSSFSGVPGKRDWHVLKKSAITYVRSCSSRAHTCDAASLPHGSHQELQKAAPLWSLTSSAYNSVVAAIYQASEIAECGVLLRS